MCEVRFCSGVPEGPSFLTEYVILYILTDCIAFIFRAKQFEMYLDLSSDMKCI